jgi:hypothetical protein
MENLKTITTKRLFYYAMYEIIHLLAVEEEKLQTEGITTNRCKNIRMLNNQLNEIQGCLLKVDPRLKSERMYII